MLESAKPVQLYDIIGQTVALPAESTEGQLPLEVSSDLVAVHAYIEARGREITAGGTPFEELTQRSRNLKHSVAIACKLMGRSPYTFGVDFEGSNDIQRYTQRMAFLAGVDNLQPDEQRLAMATLEAMSIDYAMRSRPPQPSGEYIQQGGIMEKEYSAFAPVAMPKISKRVLIEQPHPNKFNPDGSINQQFYIGCPGVWHDVHTGETVIYFKGTDPYFKDSTDPASVQNREATSGIYAAILGSDGTITYFDGKGTIDPESGEGRFRVVEDRSSAQPVVFPLHPERGHEDSRFVKLLEIRDRLEEKKAEALALGKERDAIHFDSLIARLPSIADPFVDYAKHGQEDIRLTHVEQYGVFIGAANTLNKDLLKPAKAAAYSLREPIYGAYPELYIMGDPRNPDSIVSLGDIGPAEYFKNVIFHPETVSVDGEPHLVMFMRRLPDIQAITIPVREVFSLAHDPEFRTAFWEEKLNTSNLDAHTVMRPMHAWEGANHPNNRDGQIAGGAPPILVDYPDKQSGETKKGWLMVYNTVPEYDEKGCPHGRLIGIALLDKDNPWKVVSRLPHPFVTPTTNAEQEGRYDKDIVFATGAYIDSENQFHILYTGGDINVSDAYCDAEQAIQYLASHDELGNPQ